MKLATIETISRVIPHPKADRLDITTVCGYEAIVVRGSRSLGERVVFVQPDTCLPPDQSWCSDLLKYCGSNRRVKAAKLRDKWSMGIVVGQDQLPDLDLSAYQIGEDISGMLGVTKYEPPLPTNLEAKGLLPHNIPKTDEERWQNLSDDIPYGQVVDVTLKIDGSSFTAYVVLCEDGSVSRGVCSRSLDLKIQDDATNRWVDAERKYGVLDRLEKYCRQHKSSLALRGEVYGQGIQSNSNNPHSQMPQDVAFFSVYNIDQHKYETKGSQHHFPAVCKALDLPMVPLIEQDVVLTPELIRRYDSELDSIEGRPYEGVVINHSQGSFKVINKSYDSKK